MHDGNVLKSAKECEESCAKKAGCQSFTFAPEGCQLITDSLSSVENAKLGYSKVTVYGELCQGSLACSLKYEAEMILKC